MTPARRHAPGALVVRGARILDGRGGPAAPAELWIVEGRCAPPGIGPVAGEVALPGGVVVPGLIDLHVHLCLDAGDDPLAAFAAAAVHDVQRTMRANAARTVAAGVTTVRDLGAPTPLIAALRAEIASGRVPGPRVVASGAPITSLGGHVHEMGGAVRGTEAVRDAVRGLAAAGMDLVKIMVTGGGSSPRTDPRALQFADDEVRAAVEEAASAGLQVAAHAHADDGVRLAAEAGASTIEHGSHARAASLAIMAARGTALVPTLAPAVAVLAQPGLDTARRRAIAARLEDRRRAVQEAVRLGVRVLAGTDAGVAHSRHGGLVEELRALVACGLPVATALAAATRDAGTALGIPGLGTLVPGAPADLVVLSGDPLDDLDHLARPRGVMVGGRWITRPGGAGS
jgi:imidazolonepropionase-like amidohydrolase